MRFTSTDAYEAHNDGEPLTFTRREAQVVIERHPPAVFAEFLAECESAATAMTTNANLFDAWTVLEWLGY